MDEGKVEAIKTWPKPSTIKELQRFLGFSNFYHRFILNYSTLTSPLTNLLRNKPKSLSWSPAAEEAFEKLKEAFTRAPILVHPDPERPFIVEVDASTTGVGAILSQQLGNPAKLHTCAFFSHKLSPAERNYDIGPSTLRIPSGNHLLDSLPSSTYSGTSHSCSPRMGSHRMFLRWAIGYERARGSGTKHTITFNELYAGARWQQTFEGPMLHHTNLDRRSSCQHGISDYACPARSSLPDSLAPSPSKSRSTRSPSS